MKDSNNLVQICTPKSLDFNQTFGTLKEKEQHRIKFLINDINKYTRKSGASRHNRNTLVSFFNIGTATLNKTFQLLIAHKIIHKSEEYQYEKGKKNKNNGYSMVTTFNPSNPNESVIHEYDITSPDTPDYIKVATVSAIVRTKPEPAAPRGRTKQQLEEELVNALKFIQELGGTYTPLYKPASETLQSMRRNRSKGTSPRQTVSLDNFRDKEALTEIVEQSPEPVEIVEQAQDIHDYSLLVDLTEDEIREEIWNAHSGKSKLYYLNLMLEKTETYLPNESISAVLSLAN
jgi:hypothetical protein